MASLASSQTRLSSMQIEMSSIQGRSTRSSMPSYLPKRQKDAQLMSPIRHALHVLWFSFKVGYHGWFAPGHHKTYYPDGEIVSE